MTDFANMFAYDEVYTVDIKRLDNGKPTGISIGILSSDADVVVKALRKLETDRWKEQASGAEFDLAEYLERQDKARLVAAIQSWDFSGGSFGSLNSDSEVSDENKSYLVNHPRSKWILDQLEGASGRIENFMPASPEIAPITSRKK